jgi:hypothetical protein
LEAASCGQPIESIAIDDTITTQTGVIGYETLCFVNTTATSAIYTFIYSKARGMRWPEMTT